MVCFMRNTYVVKVVQYNKSKSSTPCSTEHCIYVESKNEIEDNQDVAWFNSNQYNEIFSTPRYLDSNNKLLAIVRIEYNGRVIRRRYKFDSDFKGLDDNRIGLTSESTRILFDNTPASENPVMVSKADWLDVIMFYWNHPFHATRISTRIGLPSLLISLISLVLTLISLV